MILSSIRKSTAAFIVLLILLNLNYTIGAAVINQTVVNESATELAIAKCRQQCFSETLDEFQSGTDNNTPGVCIQVPDCYICFDYCRVLTSAIPDLATELSDLATEMSDLATEMCSDLIFCSKGCRIACNFHRIKSFDQLLYN